jgi:hypothetical protein
MIDTVVTFHVLPGKTAEFEQRHQRLLATTPECKSLFSRLPIEHHSLARGSFFEPAYEFAGDSIEPPGEDV